MDTNRYAKPLADLDAVHVPLADQVAGQAVERPGEYMAAEDLDRLRLLNDPAGAGRLTVR